MSYYTMNCEITVGDISPFQICNEVIIKKSIKELSHTSKITLPREFNTLKKKNILDFIKVGDKVTIQLGYNGNLNTEFEGYLTSIGAEKPLVLECENEAWQFRKQKFNKTFKQVTLSELLDFIAPNCEKKYLIENVGKDICLGKFVIQNANAYETLQTLKQDYLINSFFVRDVLYIGFPAKLTPDRTVKFVLGKNIRDNGNLKFVKKDDVKLKIKAISYNKNGTKTIVTVGEEGGSSVTRSFYNKTDTELRKLAENELENSVYDGLQGSLNAFGIPFADIGDNLKIQDFNNTEKNGTYIIEETNVSFNMRDGYKREISLGKKIS